MDMQITNIEDIKGKMKKFKILQVANCDYTLESETGKIYNLSFQFYDTMSPQKGEYISFSEKLLNKKADEWMWHYNFGNFSNTCGRHITMENINDNLNEVLIIERDNQNLYLKRLYG